ncbi:hypothetical protein FRC07_000391, partial [Ceratobasidium sp. 392]
MQRAGPPHYHPGSSNICYCAYASLPQYAPTPYGQTRSYTTQGDPRDYAPPLRRIPKPKPKDKLAKSREMKFDEENEQWYFETKEAPGVKWLESVWHVPDLPQAKDPDFLAMLNEYYLSGHVIDPPDQDRMPVVPGGMKHWPYARSRPPPGLDGPLPPPVPPKPQGYNPTWVEPIFNRHLSAPPYASGSAHPVSVRIPPGVPPPDGWRVHSTSPYMPQSVTAIQDHYSPAPRPHPHPHPHPHSYHYPHRRQLVDPSEMEFEGDDSDLSDSEYYERMREREQEQERGYFPPLSPKSRRRVEKLRAKGYRVTDPYSDADQLPSPSHTAPPPPSKPYTYPTPATAFIPPSTYLPKEDQKIEIHRLLQTRSTLGIAKIPELVFDLRYDPKNAFDRASSGGSDNEYWSGRKGDAQGG